MKKVFLLIMILGTFFLFNNVYAVEYLPIEYNTVSYTQGNGKSVDCNYSLVPNIYRPRLAISHDYSQSFLSSLTADLTYDQLETPVEMATRKEATLLTNLGMVDYRAPLVSDGIQLTNKEKNTNLDVAYMTKDGSIHTMNMKDTTYGDLMAEEPDWADFVYYKIVENNEFLDVSGRANYNYIRLRHPRTFFGQTSTGDYIVGVCDGRNDNVTSTVKDDGTIVESEYGLTLEELYDFVKKNITTDVKILIYPDGGGSSSFVYKGERKNRLLSSSERPRLSFLYWAVENYYVTFDANGGTGNMEKQTLKTGVSGSLNSNTFKKDTYNFIGWNTEKDGSGTSYKDNADVLDLTYRDQTVTLYAQWEKDGVNKVIVPDTGAFSSKYNIVIGIVLLSLGLSILYLVLYKYKKNN